MAAKNTTNAARARTLERQARCLELRRSGKSYTEIAAEVGIGKSQAHHLVIQGLEHARSQILASADDLKTEEISRIDAMLSGLWPDARKGHLGAVDRVLKLMERRSKYLGLDAPQRNSLEGGPEGSTPVATAATVTVYMPSNGRDAG
jgi:hypothetical protein